MLHVIGYRQIVCVESFTTGALPLRTELRVLENMPAYNKPEIKIDRWVSCLLALRLRQIEQTFETYDEFAEKSGLSKGTLFLLRYAKGNPTLHTLTTLADGFGISVWNLVGIRDDLVKDSVESFGLSFGKVKEVVRRAQAKDAETGRTSKKDGAPPVPRRRRVTPPLHGVSDVPKSGRRPA